MEFTLKKWGNGTGILFNKEFLKMAHVSQNDTLDAEILDGKIILTPVFRHRNLKDRAAEFGGELRLSEEMPIDGPVGNEVW